VRVIAASNKELKELVQQGTFREDLFYRLNVIQVQIPPLRERREDIPMLVDHFLTKHAPDSKRRLSAEALGALMGHRWPGNVRELENEIMRAAALGGEVIEPEDLSPPIRGGVPLALSDPDDLDMKTRVEHLERELILRALDRTGHNHTRSAQLLGLSRYGLLKKIRRYELGGGDNASRGEASSSTPERKNAPDRQHS
jgi:transcriptional regulator with PAS, ATPase and Fis domain